MINEEKRIFFNKRPNIHTVKMNGKKVSFNNFPEETKQKILNRLAEKDNVMARALTGEIPGIKIDGKQVTRDNIKEFELKEKIIEKEDNKVINKVVSEIKPVEIKVNVIKDKQIKKEPKLKKIIKKIKRRSKK